MPDIIDFLDSMGTRPAGAVRDFPAAVAGLAAGREARDALLRRDATALARALGGRDAMWCAIMSPEESPAESPGEETPRRDDPVRDDPQPDTEED